MPTTLLEPVTRIPAAERGAAGTSTSKLRSINADGTLEFSTQGHDETLSLSIRAWRERDFVTLREATLEDGTASKPAAAEDDAASRSVGDGMTTDELAKLRTDAGDLLIPAMRSYAASLLTSRSAAREQLMTAVDLLTIMLPKREDMPDAPLPIPHGTIAIQPLSTPLPPAPMQTRAHARSLALATKTSSLSDVAAQFGRAADRAQETVSRSQRDWATWSSWRASGEWRLEPRGAARRGAGFQSAQAMRGVAKDVVVFFGFDEASPAIRARSFAGVDREGEVVTPRQADARRMLRVELRLGRDSETHVAYARLADDESALRRAQADVLDEDLFAQLLVDLKTPLSACHTTTADDSLTISHLAGFKLHVSLVASASASSSGDPHASLCLCLLRLRLLALYRHRRSAATSTPPAVLAPVLGLLAHVARVRDVQARLGVLRQQIVASDLGELEISIDPLIDDVATIARRLATDTTVDAGALIDVAFPSASPAPRHRLGILLSALAPTPVTLMLAKRRLPLASLPQLDVYLGAEACVFVRRQLLLQLRADRSDWEWSDELGGGDVIVGQQHAAEDHRVIKHTAVYSFAFAFDAGPSVKLALQTLEGDKAVERSETIDAGPRLIERCVKALPSS